MKTIDYQYIPFDLSKWYFELEKLKRKCTLVLITHYNFVCIHKFIDYAECLGSKLFCLHISLDINKSNSSEYFFCIIKALESAYNLDRVSEIYNTINKVTANKINIIDILTEEFISIIKEYLSCYNYNLKKEYNSLNSITLVISRE